MKDANQTTVDAHDRNCCNHIKTEREYKRLCCGRNADYGRCNEIQEDLHRIW